MKINSYFKNEKVTKIVMGVLLFLIIMLVVGISTLRAGDIRRLNLLIGDGQRYWMIISGHHN